MGTRFDFALLNTFREYSEKQAVIASACPALKNSRYLSGPVGFRLLIYFKSKNAKKFRRDAEYGSARWGTEKDIKPFVDPKFEYLDFVPAFLQETPDLSQHTTFRIDRLRQNPLLAYAPAFTGPFLLCGGRSEHSTKAFPILSRMDHLPCLRPWCWKSEHPRISEYRPRCGYTPAGYSAWIL